jgi:transposase
MSSSYSLDLRVRVVAKYDEGFTYDDVAEMFSVHPRTVRRWVKLRDAEGHLDNKAHGGGPSPTLDEAGRAELRRLHEADEDAYLYELSERLSASLGKPVSEGIVGRELAKMGITRKKNGLKQRSKTPRKSKPSGPSSSS